MHISNRKQRRKKKKKKKKKKKNEMNKFKRVRILTATSSFQSSGQIGAPTGKLLISLLNEQNPHCYILSVLPIFYFTMLPIAQFSAAKE